MRSGSWRCRSTGSRTGSVRATASSPAGPTWTDGRLPSSRSTRRSLRERRRPSTPASRWPALVPARPAAPAHRSSSSPTPTVVGCPTCSGGASAACRSTSSSFSALRKGPPGCCARAVLRRLRPPGRGGDYTIMTESASLALSGPEMVRVATGEEVTHLELGGPDVAAATVGSASAVVASEEEAIATMRLVLGYLPDHAGAPAPTVAPSPAAVRPGDVARRRRRRAAEGLRRPAATAERGRPYRGQPHRRGGQPADAHGRRDGRARPRKAPGAHRARGRAHRRVPGGGTKGLRADNRHYRRLMLGPGEGETAAMPPPLRRLPSAR